MQFHRLIQIASALGLSVALAGSALAHEGHDAEAAKGAKAGEPCDADMMAQYMKLMEPGEMHRKLDTMVGDWEVTSRVWMAGPDQPPAESKGRAVTKWALDRHYLVEEFHGDVMGTPFEGRSTLGYDNFRKQYVGSWIDSMMTTISLSTGNWSRDGKTLTMYMRMDEPMTGEINKMVRMTFTVVSKDEHVMAMYDLAQGEDFKTMELHYKRKK